jgi:cell division protein FtsW (lipid II flippase)
VKILGYIVGAVLAVLAAFTLVAFLVTGDLWFYKTYAPKYEQARYNTFKQSQAYNDGMAQQLSHYRLQYQQADASGKALIRSTVLHDYAGYDSSHLSPDLASFLDSLQNP